MSFLQELHKPDILDCISHLSSDEVFTPPRVVNEMLDTLPQELFKSPDTKFLDPCSKSGVFLREIAKRLIDGLADKIPDLEKRLDHIFKNQLFGLAITELTALLSRRSVYCSKDANGEYSVVHFDNPEGNIEYNRTYHIWFKDKCMMCGASKSEYDRGEELETHAYSFIHTDEQRNSALFKRLKEMKFDVIIGNPPYQLSTGGSVEAQSLPLYQKFVEQAKKLNPRYITMIIPSRWMNGGFGLDNFRNEMLNDRRIRKLHDFFDANECFQGISLPGGVCYFLWDRDNQGICEIYTHKDNKEIVVSNRYLLEEGLTSFIRFSEALSILKKVKKYQEPSFSDIVSPRDPFGLNYYENGSERMFKLFHKERQEGDCEIYYNGWQREGICFANRSKVTTRLDAIDLYKVFISKANGAASNKIPYSVLSKPFIGKPNTICNMTYLMIGPFENNIEAENVQKYICTKFCRFLVSLMKNTQNALKKVYELVPMQDFNEEWTDEKLYKKYELTQEEIDFIESMIRPME